MKKYSGHTFHIPVMGIGYTIDTPLKVSQYGMDSAISLGDDMLLEKMREYHCVTNKIAYKKIESKTDDFRAKRITSYLNLINELAEKKIENLKNTAIEKSAELKKYFEMLPDGAQIKEEFKKLTSKYLSQSELSSWLKKNLTMGSIDVNVMTKVDKENFSDGNVLPSEHNNAHTAIKGFAKSNLNSSIILSAGMNPRLYGYLDKFEEFFPNENGEFKKKVVLKVSDFRSALIQGKFLAKKGIWVSEYRVESGLNCGGHAFATDGHLLGPILAEFRDKRNELVDAVYTLLSQAFENLKRPMLKNAPVLKITAQGGVGTAEEHQFLLDHYNIDSVGWGTPFLLVPEAISIDHTTIHKLEKAKEEDLYLSNISPLGVPFNNLRGNTKDIDKMVRIDQGRPGSKCPKNYLSFNKEFTEEGICTASRQYQRLKLKELSEKDLSEDTYNRAYKDVTDKSCICVGLGTSALLSNKIDTKVEGLGVSICPGPNMAYFSKSMSLKEITSHIYGKINVITRTDRPMMFVKELIIYIDYLKNRIDESQESISLKQEKYLSSFSTNLQEGIRYYQNLFNDMKESFKEEKDKIFEELESGMEKLKKMSLQIEELSLPLVTT